MTATVNKRGIVYTFYSYKGGVGRTMALANVAVLLARRNFSVLVIDWDLEAPGLERFFLQLKPDVPSLRSSTPGVVDLLNARKTGEELNWRNCVIDIPSVNSSGRLSLITSGRSDETYSATLHSLDFPELFDKYSAGEYLEGLRNEWLADYDVILLDSRTGVSDIGGVCTVHLADVIVAFFTANESSTAGVLQVVKSARKAHAALPVERGLLLAVPVPSRDESRTEHQLATSWKERFTSSFDHLFRDWLPSGVTTREAIERIRIPYVPYWSFGERLPVLEENASDPSSLASAYDVLARLLSARLDWYQALKGVISAPAPNKKSRADSEKWLERHRQTALRGLKNSEFDGFMEILHYCVDSVIDKRQSELLTIARQAQIRTFGWPIGVVLDRDQVRPMPVSDGIVANVSTDLPLGRGKVFDYWTLTRNGDFYTLMALFEDNRDEIRPRRVIFADSRIVRATEALLHCGNLYKALGVEPDANIEFTARYGGLKGRSLAIASPNRAALISATQNQLEDEIDISPVSFRLSSLETDLVELVKKLCEPLFEVFDFSTFSDDVYAGIVKNFLNGRII
jgi:cellulose biosynthesis protein BcsQ